MAEPSKPSGAARLSILYITIGALMVVWTTLYYFFFLDHSGPAGSLHFWCYGFFFTGLTLIIIGVAVGSIGRAARHAELPPDPLVPKPAAPAAVLGVPQGAVPTAAPGAVPVAVVPTAAAPPAVPVRR
jgi:hypothetical protein